MGLREKVALLLIAVIFQIACTNCKPQSLKPNPFERYIGKKGNRKCTGNTFAKPNIYETYNFPKVDYPLDPLQKELTVNYGSINKAHTPSNQMYDPTLLDSFKKEVRKKRKSKKHVNEDVPLQSNDMQPLYTVDKRTFPEVEYPMNAMDTWIPKYWNESPYNTDDSFNQNIDLMLQNVDNANQINLKKYENNSNRKPNNKLMPSATKPTDNKNKIINFVKPNISKNSKMISPVTSNTNLKQDGLLSAAKLMSSYGRQIQRKPKPLIKPTPYSKLNDINILAKHLKSRQRSGTLMKTKTSSSNKNNSLSFSQNNINSLKSLCAEISNKTMTAKSFSNITSFDEADKFQLKKLTTSELRNLAEKLLALIGPIPNEFENIPNFFTLDNLTDITKLISNFSTPQDNANDNMRNYSFKDLTAMYNLADQILEQISTQNNNSDTPNESSVVITSTNLSPTDTSNPIMCVRNNDLSIVTPTDYNLPDFFIANYNNMNNTSCVNFVEQVCTTLISENSTTDSLSLSPNLITDQCAINDSPESLSPNCTLYSLINILNGTTLNKDAEKPEILVELNGNPRILQGDSETLCILKYSDKNNNFSEKRTRETIYNDDTSKITPDNCSSIDMSQYDANARCLIDITEYDTATNNAEIVLKYNPQDSNLYNISYGEKFEGTQANVTLKDLPINNASLNMPDYIKLENQLGNQAKLDIPITLLDLKDRQISENKTLECNKLFDTPGKNASKDILDIPDQNSEENSTFIIDDKTSQDNDITKMQEYDILSGELKTLSDIPKDEIMDSLEKNEWEILPAFSTITSIPDNKILEDELTYQELDNDPPNYTLSVMQLNDSSLEKLEKLENLFTNDTLQFLPDSLEDNNKSNEMPENDALSNILESETLPIMLNDETSELVGKNNVFLTSYNTMTSTQTIHNETIKDKSASDDNFLDYMLSDIPNNESLSEMPDYNNFSNSQNENLSYEQLEDIFTNDTLIFLPDDNNSQEDNNESKDTPEYNIFSYVAESEALTDMPNNDTVNLLDYKLQILPTNDEILIIPQNETVKYSSVNYTMSDNGVLENNTFSDNRNIFQKTPTYESSEENISVNNTLTNIKNNETSEDSYESKENLELNILPYMSKSEESIKPLGDKTSNISDNNELEGISVSNIFNAEPTNIIASPIDIITVNVTDVDELLDALLEVLMTDLEATV